MAVRAETKLDRGQNKVNNAKQARDEELEGLMRQEFAQLGINPEPGNTQGSRRKLLLIYIHGFLGSEESFRSFPAHVHSLLAILLAETHVVHSKIYPRYRSRKNIRVASEELSAWLQPHESTTTDVILLGHSMGGLISAEIVVMPGPESSPSPFLHRILGTLNFDVPFIGMHPGVVKSGLASIFSPAKEPEDKYVDKRTMSQMNETAPEAHTGVLDSDDSSFWESQDANFNAAYSNDKILPERKFWQSVAHFVHKHGRDLAEATSSMVSSHVEFMSAMSNSKELRGRYTKVRMLEEENQALRKSVVQHRVTPPRVRFVNYYTVSTGRIKHAQDEQSKQEEHTEAPNATTGTVTTAREDKMREAGIIVDAATQHSGADAKDAQTFSVAPTEEVPAAQDSLVHLPPFGQVTAASEAGTTSASSAQSVHSDGSRSRSPKPPRQGTFCTLPPKDSQGQRDPVWVRMFMEDVDEVGAHCGMFFVDERYERFVGDVAGRIEDWVKEDLSVRAAMVDPAIG